MTFPEAQVHDAVARSTQQSGVPYHLEDPQMQARIAQMFATKKSPAVVAARPSLPKE